MQSFKEPTLSTENIFQGRFITLQVDTVRLPNGHETTREIVKHPGATAILAETNEGHVILVRQFRKSCERELIEIPAGKLDKDEEPLTCAKRELLEETGMTASTWKHLHSMFTSPGFANECIHLFYAKGLSKGTQQLDDDEFLDLMEVDRDQVEHLLSSGQIEDAKTLTALYFWLRETDSR